MNFPFIDRATALRQLELLGYQDDNVYLRFFYPSDDPRKDTDKGRKSNRLNWQEIENYQRQGRGAYFVINGGGHKNEDVTVGRAIFVEHDNLDKEIQRELWKTLELPEPTFQVDTGGKSIHSYWVFDQPLSIEKWRSLQRDLLEFADGDRSIQNPARVMRLAGAWHISFDEKGNRVYNQSQIIFESGKVYTYEELRTVIPVFEADNSLPLTEPGDKNFHQPNSQKVRHPEQIQIPVSAPVPLKCCLAKESRCLLEHGVGVGERNSGGAKLARDLIGTYNYLTSIGQSVDGDPRSLLDDYANRCTPPINSKEVETIWRSAIKSHPTPSCGSEGVDNCIKGWYWNEFVKKAKSTTVSPNSSTHTGQSPQAQKSSCTLHDRIGEILSRFDSEALQVNALMDLASVVGRPYRDIELLTRIVKRQKDFDDDVATAISHVSANLRHFRVRLDLKRYLEPNFASLLLDAADSMPTAPEYLFNPLLSTSASVVGTAARILVNPGGGYVQPMIFWTGNIAHSGQAKTPPQKVVVQPLADLEAEAYTNYEEELKEYEKDKSTDAYPPTRKRFLLNNVTIPLKIRIHSENPRGLLEYLDELVSDYTRLNQYKRGVGDDLQQELTFFNGDNNNYDRGDVRLLLKRTGFSKTGTYQWDTLARLMEDEVNFVASGYSARFLLCSILDAPIRYLDLFKSNDAVQKFQTALRELYESLSRLPVSDYFLTSEAKVLFEAWNHTLVDAEMLEEHFGLSLVYSKIEAYTARLALWLHIVNAVLRHETPAPVISGTTMQHAIEIASFYLWQHKSIHAHNSPTRQLEGILLKAQTQAEKYFSRTGKGIGASWLKTRLNALKNWCVEKIRTSVFQVLATAGFGRIEGEGAQMVYLPNSNNSFDETIGEANAAPSRLGKVTVGGVGGKLVEPPIALKQMPQEIQSIVDKIGEANAAPSLHGKATVDEVRNLFNHQKTNSLGGCHLQQKIQEADSQEATLVNSSPTHQFTNCNSTNVDVLGASAIGESIGELHQTSIHLESVNWLVQFLSDLELEATPHPRWNNNDELEASLNEAELKANSCREELEKACPDYWERVGSALATTIERLALLSESASNETQQPLEDSQPTLAQLQALLLACKSLSELKTLKLHHREQVSEAYRALPTEQQLIIDGIAATTVNHQVFKYVGKLLEKDGQRLLPGALVYLDPHTNHRPSSSRVGVWSLSGVKLGWSKAIDISRDCLRAVEKAIAPGVEVVEGEQGMLFEL